MRLRAGTGTSAGGPKIRRGGAAKGKSAANESHQPSRVILRAGGGRDRLIDRLVPAARPVLLPPPPGPPPAALRRARRVRAGDVHHGALHREYDRKGRRAKPMMMMLLLLIR